MYQDTPKLSDPSQSSYLLHLVFPVAKISLITGRLMQLGNHLKLCLGSNLAIMESMTYPEIVASYLGRLPSFT